MQDFVLFLEHLPPIGILAGLFGIAFVENIFPPSPSDVAIVFGGTLVGLGTVGFFPALIATTAGSVLGFVFAYEIGRRFGERIIEKGKIKFIPIESVHKVEAWFRTYGYGIIVANRFLSGTRAVVSFVAGMAGMDLLRTTIFCAVSALGWNAALLIGGELLGENWTAVGSMIETYSMWVTIAISTVAVFFIARWQIGKRRKTNTGPPLS